MPGFKVCQNVSPSLTDARLYTDPRHIQATHVAVFTLTGTGI